MKNRIVTIKDIAKELGIAPSTVSRALKNHENISISTRERVHELAKKWKYQPNALAASLKSNRTMVLGVIIPELIHHFFSTVLSGIEDEARKAGYKVIFTQSDESFEREKDCIKSMLSSHVDGVLASISKETESATHLQELANYNVPLVLFDRISKEVKADYVVVDDFEGAKNIVSILIRSGCKRILHLGTSGYLLISENRKNGYKDALRAHQIAVDKELIRKADNYDEAYSLIQGLLHQGLDFDGVFAINDEAAIGALNALRDAGHRVPEDKSVVGFSGSFISQMCTPPLTTSVQDGYQMGKIAASLLLARIKDNERPFETKVVRTHIRIGGTTK